MPKAQSFKDTAIKAVTTAGTTLLAALLSDDSIISHPKGENDIETDADRLSGQIIKQTILSAYPDHGIKFEEDQLSIKNNSPYLWVVDSIAGTIHFDAKYPHFGINVALEKEGTPVLGINYFPYTDDLYIAEKGQGAFHINNRLHIDKRMRVNSISKSEEGLLLLDSGKSLEKRIWTGKIFNAVVPHFSQVDKLSNSQEAGLLGTTKAVGYISDSAWYWDFIGQALIVEESGGRATDISGKPLTQSSRSVIYSNGLLHDYLVHLVSDIP